MSTTLRPGVTTQKLDDGRVRHIFTDRGDFTILTVEPVSESTMDVWLEIDGRAVALENDQIDILIDALIGISTGDWER